jgi:hypothetical protein
MARESLKYHWHFKDDGTLVDRISSLTWTLDTGGPSVFSADGLEMGNGDPQYSITSGVTDISVTEGILYAEMIIDSGQTVDSYVFTVSDGTETDFLQIRIDDLERPESIVIRIGGVEALLTGGVITLGETFRFAMSYKANDVKHWFNGTEVTSDTTVTLPTGPHDQLHLGQSSVTAGPGIHGPIAEIRYYDLEDGGTGDADQFMEDLTNGLINEDPPEGGSGGGGGGGGRGGTPGRKNPRKPPNPRRDTRRFQPVRGSRRKRLL